MICYEILTNTPSYTEELKKNRIKIILNKGSPLIAM